MIRTAIESLVPGIEVLLLSWRLERSIGFAQEQSFK